MEIEDLLCGKVYQSVELGELAQKTWQKEIAAFAAKSPESKELGEYADNTWHKENAAFAAQSSAFARSGVDWDSYRPTKRSPKSSP